MTVLAAAALLAISTFSQPRWPDRASFGHRMGEVQRAWSMDRVRGVLGDPEDIWPPNDSRRYVVFGDTVWCYGTNGHHTLPTLGYVLFRRNEVIDVVGRAWPFIPMISERHSPTSKGGIFPEPMNGSSVSSMPDDVRNWPIFPLAFVDDIPLSIFNVGIMVDDRAFTAYLERFKGEWQIRQRPLIPPDDPFAVIPQLKSLPVWPPARTNERLAAAWNSVESWAQSQVLALVRSAYRPSTAAMDFEECHREFLALRCRWDSARQMYVRGDGTVPQ